MKNKIYIILVIFLLVGSVALAHPPDSLKVSFDTTGTIMIAHIFHATKNPSMHLIYQVQVVLNGKQVIQQAMAKQYNNAEQTAVYQIIDAKKGDKIFVTAMCNVLGKKGLEIIAPGPKIKQF